MSLDFSVRVYTDLCRIYYWERGDIKMTNVFEDVLLFQMKGKISATGQLDAK